LCLGSTIWSQLLRSWWGTAVSFVRLPFLCFFRFFYSALHSMTDTTMHRRYGSGSR
jgi:hypothetical protein